MNSSGANLNPPDLSLDSIGETGGIHEMFPNKAELLKRATDKECQRTCKHWLPVWAAAASASPARGGPSRCRLFEMMKGTAQAKIYRQE